jgi:multidrug efflux pump subunit AcrA (membrane-fusion protein)
VNDTVKKLLALLQGGQRNRGMFSAVVASWSVASLAKVVDERVTELNELDALIEERKAELESLRVHLEDADATQPPADPTAEDSRPEGVPSALEEDGADELRQEISGVFGDLAESTGRPMIDR